MVTVQRVTSVVHQGHRQDQRHVPTQDHLGGLGPAPAPYHCHGQGPGKLKF